MKPASLRSLRHLLVILVTSACAYGGEFFIHNGDRVVFLGDSITEQRLYTTYIEAYALTRHPDWNLWFRNVGWGGDTAWLRQRSHPNEEQLFAADPAEQQQMVDEAVGHGLSRDVLPLKPTAVTVDFGMNDHEYQAFRPDIFRAYIRSQTEIAKELTAAGARVAFLTPQPIEENRPDPDKDVKNISLRKFSDGLKEVAQKTGTLFVDQFDPYMKILLRERAGNPPELVGRGNAVHPGPTGHTLMAWAILTQLGAAPLVSSAAIDASASQVTASEDCQIQNLKVSGKTVSFDRLDQALPMPIDPRAEPALKLAPVLADLDQYILQVTALPQGSYQLSIDGEPVGEASADELAKGWNLATHAGPITQQAQAVLQLVFQKNDLYFTRWRDVQLYSFPAWARSPETSKLREAELARLDHEIAAKEAAIDAKRKPSSHHFELKPSGA